jgi:hypothetical protein
MILDALAVAALVALGVWVFSGLLLRLAGLVAIVAGLGATALGGGVTGLLVAGVGAAFWLLGHRICLARNGFHRSTLAAFLIGRTRRG